MRLLELVEYLLGLLLARISPERLELLHHPLVQGRHPDRGEAHRDSLGEEWEQPALVNWVVQDLSLELLAASLELAAHGRVPDRDRQGLLGHLRRVGHHRRPPLQQRTVRQLRQRGLLHLACASDLSVLHEHVSPRDAHVGELDPAVVDPVTAHLLANVADRDPRQELERLWVAQGDDEGLGPVALAGDPQLGEHGAVGRGLGRAPDPPLGRGD